MERQQQLFVIVFDDVRCSVSDWNFPISYMASPEHMFPSFVDAIKQPENRNEDFEK